MKPGHAMNLLVAEKVLDLAVCRGNCGLDGCDLATEENTPPYSTEIAAAWAVVEKIEPEWRLSLEQAYGESSEWSATLYREPHGWIEAEGDTAPEAICRAALAACGVEVPDA